MNSGKPKDSWGFVSKSFHWTIGVLIIMQLLFGLFLSTLNLYLPADLKTYVAIISPHKSLGLTIMALAILRLAWRLANVRPAMPDSSTPFERRVAKLSHGLMYFLLIALPLLGLIQSSAYRAKTTFWGLFQLPDIVPAAYARPGARGVWKVAQNGHTALAVILFVTIVLHIAAALRHHFVKHDDVLIRMLPGGYRANGSAPVA